MIISALRGKFHDELGLDTDKFPMAIMDIPFSPQELRDLVAKKTKSTRKTFQPISFERVKNDILGVTILSHSYNKVNKKLSVQSESGMFKITFNDDTFLFVAQRAIGFGKSMGHETIAVGDKKVISNYFNYVYALKLTNSKPKIGFYKIGFKNSMNGRELVYTKVNPKIGGKVFHQNKELINSDVAQFFDNIDQYTRYGQPGSRRALLVGEPGGGKTSAAMELAQKYATEMCVVIATDLDAVIAHNANVSKHNMPTIILLEDAEATIPWGNSYVLNYLDGVNQPKTPKGCYTILTTNYPSRLEGRILKRPGRIDKIIKFGVLDKENTIKCINHYFKGILFASTDDKEVVKQLVIDTYKGISKNGISDMTGAQIKNLSESVISYSVSNSIQKIGVEHIVKVKEILESDLKDIYDMAVEESLNAKQQPMGFSTSAPTVIPFEPEDDWFNS